MSSIATEIARLNKAKSDIKASIENKGVVVPNSALISDYSTYIDLIPTGTVFKLDGTNFDYLMTKGGERVELLPHCDLSNCTSFTYFMNECKLDEFGAKLTTLDLRDLKLEGVEIENGNYAFNSLTNCTTLILPESEWNVRATNYMFGAFAGTKITNIEKLGDDIGTNATCDHRNMFRNCPNLLECDLSGYTARVCTTNYWQNCFYQCPKLRKVWIPKTCINIGATTYAYSLFNNSNKDCEIFTDAPSQPSTWTGCWNYFNASVVLTVHYGATKEQYEAF